MCFVVRFWYAVMVFEARCSFTMNVTVVVVLSKDACVSECGVASDRRDELRSVVSLDDIGGPTS